MKIVYLCSSAIPSRTANSIHVMKMCRAFSKNGHNVVLIAPNRQDDLEPGIEDVFAFYGVEKCFEIVKLPWLLVKGRAYIYGLSAARKARKFKPDLVYCRSNTAGSYFTAKMGLPVIFESHSPEKNSGRLSEWMFRGLTRNSLMQKLVVITHALKKYYETNYPQIAGKIQVAPDGADRVPESIEPEKLPGSGNSLRVGYTGQLYAGKGMEVISKLAYLCPWADFHVVGGTKKDLSYWKEECKTCRNIFFHGHVPHSKIVRYILAFDVVLMPNQDFVAAYGKGKSNIARWSSPLKVFEYMAAARPVISSDLPVLREVLENKRNALLCPPEDVHAWKNALELLRDDQSLRAKLGGTAYKQFLENYTWEKRAEKLLGAVIKLRSFRQK